MEKKPIRKKYKEKPRKFWNERELALLFSHIGNERDLLMMYLMAFCGLAATELCYLKVGDIDLDKRILRIQASPRLKKREIPMDDRVCKQMVICLEKWPRSSEEYLIQQLKGSSGPRHRCTINKIVRRYAAVAHLSNGCAEILRNSYGVMLASRGASPCRIAELMGLVDVDRVGCYRKLAGLYKTKTVPRSGLRSRVICFVQSLVQGKTKEKTLSLRGVRNPIHWECRSAERRKLKNNLTRGIDTLIAGPPGIGKSYLLYELQDHKIIHPGQFVPLKPAVLFVAQMLFLQGVLDHGCGNPETWDEVKRAHSKATVKQWCLMILKSVKKDEWAIVIDDMTDLTKSATEILRMLDQKFVLFGAVREIKKSLEPFFWKFDRIDLGPLTNTEARRLILHLSGGAVFEDYPVFETYVLNRSACNPRAISEIIERARKETVITVKYSTRIENSGAVKYIDISPVFVVLAALFIASRYIARGLGDMELYMFAGIGGALFMVLRLFSFRTRR